MCRIDDGVSGGFGVVSMTVSMMVMMMELTACFLVLQEDMKGAAAARRSGSCSLLEAMKKV